MKKKRDFKHELDYYNNLVIIRTPFGLRTRSGTDWNADLLHNGVTHLFNRKSCDIWGFYYNEGACFNADLPNDEALTLSDLYVRGKRTHTPPGRPELRRRNCKWLNINSEFQSSFMNENTINKRRPRGERYYLLNGAEQSGVCPVYGKN